MTIKSSLILFVVIAYLKIGYAENSKIVTLQSGDILFCSYNSGDLSGAIDEVTQTTKSTHYSHMALVEIYEQDTFVIHASLKRGVVKELLKAFMLIDQPSLVDVYRLTDSMQYAVLPAIENAQNLLGLPYNSHYILNDSCYYCSQLIYEIFKANNVFKLEPMTFKNTGTNQFNQGWVNYYNALSMDIPEGQLGCNPNGLATSKNLIFIGRLKK